ncbi:hypothetical protein Sru01_21980 [Sphaerisporangium rufum]|uniref:histidine kinase n=1 Tax=Sphaerisporangium rufum TaxID=1381558 RepID=A0A919UXP4_9ACTN|nr:HAMP domain-containing sensor histidine kinase [Sphaerisporangium rufum]GII77216.1 hypothetical protein Sru01_21980 [Sphaerisporangium rufum]
MTRRRLSLRARLLLIVSALLAAGLVLSGSIVVGLLRAGLVDRVDRQLRALGGLAAVLPPEWTGAGVPAARALAGDLDVVSDVYLAHLAPDGTVRREARIPVVPPGGPAAGGPVLPPLDGPGVSALAGTPFETAGRAGGGRWRVLVLPRARSPLRIGPGSGAGSTGGTGQGADGAQGTGSGAGAAGGSGVHGAGSSARGEQGGAGSAQGEEIAGAGGGEGAVVVAASLDAVAATVGRLRAAHAATGAGLLALLSLAGWFAIGAGLRPLRRIEDTAAAIAAGDLTRRVPDAAGPGTEVGRLAASLNGMLGQVERAFAARAESEARLRALVADVGHELRTPLFGIKGFSELYRMGGLTDVPAAMARIESEAGRLARLVEDLLLLARLDEGGAALALEPAPMDLRTLAADARLDLRALAPDRDVELTGPDGGPPGSAPVLGDEARLRQVVTNLVGNVVAHTPAGSSVRIGVGTAGGEAVLVIADRGPGLPAEHAARVFDRFYRADDSRSRSHGGGAGLGLAIARSLVAAHGGRLDLRTAPGDGAAFTIALPATVHPPGPLEPPAAPGRSR